MLADTLLPLVFDSDYPWYLLFKLLLASFLEFLEFLFIIYFGLNWQNLLEFLKETFELSKLLKSFDLLLFNECDF